MKRNIPLFLIAFLCFLATDMQAQEWETLNTSSCCLEDKRNFYGEILGGANFLQYTNITKNKTSYRPGYIIQGSLGYYLSYGLRVEAEYAYRRNSIRKIHLFGQGSSSNGHFQSSSCMVNLLSDLPLHYWGCAFWDIQPIIGAGIGYDFQQMHVTNSRIDFHQKWNQFSWQLMAGLSYPIYCNTEITLEYKFHQGGCHFYNHSVGIGFLYQFSILK